MTQGSPTWITVTDAATLTRRTTRTVYRWLDAGDLRSRKRDDGTVLVRGDDVLDVERRKKRGRPPRVA